MAIFQLLYASGATGPVNEADIDAILGASLANNRRLGVTGVLLHAERTFIQLLEGDRATVEALAETIRRDPRHRNFMVLVERQAEARAFSAWHMGFRRLDMARLADRSVFTVSRRALVARLSPDDRGVMLDTILAFTGRDFLAEAS